MTTTTVLIIFGAVVAVQFVWYLAREVEKRSQQRSWRMAQFQARDILTRQLIGRIHALEQQRDRHQIGTREYEALDLEAYEVRRELAALETLQDHAA